MAPKKNRTVITALITVEASDDNGTNVSREFEVKFDSFSNLFLFLEDLESQSEDN